MAQVNPQGSRRVALHAHHVDGSPEVIQLTVMSADLYRNGTLAGVEFFEYPGFVVWARGTELQALADALGGDTDGWPHGRVVLEKVRRNNPHKGEVITKYVVAPVAEWPRLADIATAFDKGGRAQGPRRVKARKGGTEAPQPGMH